MKLLGAPTPIPMALAPQVIDYREAAPSRVRHSTREAATVPIARSSK